MSPSVGYRKRRYVVRNSAARDQMFHRKLRRPRGFYWRARRVNIGVLHSGDGRIEDAKVFSCRRSCPSRPRSTRPRAVTFPSLTTIYVGSGVRDNGAATDAGVATSIHCSNVSGVSVQVRVLILGDTGAVARFSDPNSGARGNGNFFNAPDLGLR